MKGLRRILTILLALVFMGSASMVIAQLIQYRAGAQAYEQATELADLPDLTQIPLAAAPEIPDDPEPILSGDAPLSEPAFESSQTQTEAPPPVYQDPYADALRNMDFSALRQVNEDVLGWILIPNTKISYPLLQGEDNEFYLKHNWNKVRNSTGSIYLECQNSSDLSDFNTILYGHRMSDRSMFGLLKKYKEPEYWNDHSVVYLTDTSGCRTYEVFAAFEVGVTQQTYRLGEFDEEAKQAFIDFSLEQSVIDTGVVPTVYDRILTLSTCTGNGHETRWVVQAVLRGEAPSDTALEQMPEHIDAKNTQADSEPVPPEPPVEAPAESPVSQDIRRP